jgi:anti-anti-sigma factor
MIDNESCPESQLPAEQELQLVLEGEVRIGSAATLHDLALRAARESTRALVDCARVDYLDTSAVQILLALKKACTSRDGYCRLVNVPAPVVGSLQRLGLAGLLVEENPPDSPSSSRPGEV